MIHRVQEALDGGYSFDDTYSRGFQVGDTIRGFGTDGREMWVKIRTVEELEQVIAQRKEKTARLWGTSGKVV